MSLSKQYQLSCDGHSLLMDRMRWTSTHDGFKDDLAATRADRSTQLAGCKNYSVTEFSSVEARRSAKAQGWRRHTEDRPIYAGARETTKGVYDLCPSCAPIADQR